MCLIDFFDEILVKNGCFWVKKANEAQAVPPCLTKNGDMREDEKCKTLKIKDY